MIKDRDLPNLIHGGTFWISHMILGVLLSIISAYWIMYGIPNIIFPLQTTLTPTEYYCELFQTVFLIVESNLVIIGNEFVLARFNLTHPCLQSLEGRFSSKPADGGWAEWTETLGSRGLRLMHTKPDKTVLSCAQLGVSNASPLSIKEKIVNSSFALITIDGICDHPTQPTTIETWTLSISIGSRAMSLFIRGRILLNNSLSTIEHVLETPHISTYALFPDDMSFIQMMKPENHKTHYYTKRDLHRFYSLGGGSSLEIIRESPKNNGFVVLENHCIDYCDRGTCVSKSKINFSNIPSALGWSKLPNDSSCFMSGLHEIHVGMIPPKRNYWTTQQHPDIIEVREGYTYSLRWSLFPNNGDFPLSTVSKLDSNLLESTANIYTCNLHMLTNEHTAAVLTSIYATLVGTVHYFDEQIFISPTVHAPKQGYGGNFNFFDPDSFFILMGFTYSGDTDLIHVARRVILTTAEEIRSDGAIPHHFSHGFPEYRALSNAIMPGPNYFWLLATLQHAAHTGNKTWLSSLTPTIDLAFQYLLSMYDDNIGLFYVDGPLMIDTVNRAGYTTDFNTAMALLLPLLEEFYQDRQDIEMANHCHSLTSIISDKINKLLWSHMENDHFITSLKNITEDPYDILDMVDYDSNLLSIVSGVANINRSVSIMRRLYSNGSVFTTNYRPTPLSEKFYDARFCYNNNTGDSNVSFGRIMYLEGKARHILNDSGGFLAMIEPVINDLLQWTWLPERYDLDGYPRSHRGFFEYPAVASILIYEVIYGIHITFHTIHVVPWIDVAPPRWVWGLGNIHVKWSPSEVLLTLPFNGTYNVKVGGLQVNTRWKVQETVNSKCLRTIEKKNRVNNEIVTSNEEGIVCFSWVFKTDCTLAVVLI